MRKFAILGGTIFLCGVLLLIIAFAAGGWNLQSLSTKPAFEIKNIVYDNENQNIVLKDLNANVKIDISEDDSIHITFNEREKEYYGINTDNGISFTKINEYKWYEQIFSINIADPEFILLLPPEFRGNIDITTTNGNIKVKNIMQANIMNLKTTNGNIKAEGVILTDNFDIVTTNGNITLADISAKNISVSTTNGDISGNSTYAAVMTEFKTTNGDIAFSRLNSGFEIRLKSTNGKIQGSIVGQREDYKITSHTTNGSNNLLPNTFTGSKVLNVGTTNGKINVTFL